MSDDPVLDYMLRDDEFRDDPDYRAAMRKTIAYDATALSFQLHAAVEDGIASLPRWARPLFRGYQRLYQRWFDPVGVRIRRWKAQRQLAEDLAANYSMTLDEAAAAFDRAAQVERKP